MAKGTSEESHHPPAPSSPSADTVNVMLITSGGGGAREHSLAWRLKQSPRIGRLWLADATSAAGTASGSVGLGPGAVFNPGLLSLGEPVPEDVPVDVRQAFRLQRFCD